MAKGILEFNLLEEREEFNMALKGQEYLGVIEEMDNYLRGKLKYEELKDEEYAIYQAVRDKLWELRNQ